MAIPIAVPVIAGLTGLFFGSQIDDAIEKSPESKPSQNNNAMPGSSLTPLNLALYGVAGVSVYFLGKRLKVF